MFAKLFRDEPEVLALVAIVAIAAIVPPPVWRFRPDPLFPLVEHSLPKIEFIRL